MFLAQEGWGKILETREYRYQMAFGFLERRPRDDSEKEKTIKQPSLYKVTV